MAEQNYANHVKWVPAFHFFRDAGAGAEPGRVHLPVVLAALVALLFLARLFALKVQDRVIRLEERLRMERLLPADVKPRIEEFTAAQLVGLRFASDRDLPELARKVLSDKIQGTKAIKLMVRNWRADYLRA